MRLYWIILTILLAFYTQAAAHGPSIEISGLKVSSTEEGVFLQAQIDPPEGGATLTAISTPFGSAQFEGRNSSGYRPTGRIPIRHEHSTLGVATEYRVRLPEISSRERTVPVTLLFSGGSIVQSEAQLARPSIDYRPWMGAAAAVVLALLTLKLAKMKRPVLSRSEA